MLRDASGRLVLTRGWKIFHICMAVVLVTAIVLLSVFLGLSKSEENKWMTRSENNYESAYYTLTDSLLNIENNLSKLRITRSDLLVNEMLIDIAMNSQTAVSNLTILSYSGYDMASVVKYYNQVGDYSKYLAHKITSGLELNDNDYKTLGRLYDITYKIGKKLNSVKDSLMSGNKIATGMKELNDYFVDIATSLQDGSIVYPSLIYDGAFSDSLEDREAKALTGEDVKSDSQNENIKKILCDYNVKSITYMGESDNGFVSYMYKVVLDDNSQVSLQLAKKGGTLVMWDKEFHSQEPKLSMEEGVELAEQYMKKLGYTDMKGVYACVTNSVLYVNMCFVKDDIIYYPDMVKIKVSLDDGKILGFEGLNYIYNHTQRQIESPEVTEGQIRNMDFGGLEIKSVRLALIPMENGKETLTYEVYGTIEGFAFYVFIDAKSGNAVKVMQIIDSDEGELLM